jgi:serine/threonine protein kinase
MCVDTVVGVLRVSLRQDHRECFMKPDYTTGGLRRVSAFFYVLSLHHRTLQDVVLVQHPEQRPLPFRYVIAVVSGIADALEAAADVGVVHLDMKEDNVMVDDPEAMDFEAEQIAADATTVDYSKLIRRFEEPPEAVVVDWGTAMQFVDEWVVVVPTTSGSLTLPEGAQPWGNQHHASPELCVEWRRATVELERATVAVAQAYRSKTAAEQGESSMFVVCVVSVCVCVAHVCWFLCVSLCRRRPG